MEELETAYIGTVAKAKGEKWNNCEPSILDFEGIPAFYLFALTDIAEGAQLLYVYGVSNLPWKQ